MPVVAIGMLRLTPGLPPESATVLHLLNAQWKLPGPSSPYLIVWWHDEAAKVASRHVSPFEVSTALEGWSRSRRQTLREIYEALEANQLTLSSGARRELHNEHFAIKQRIAAAFRAGQLVALRAKHLSSRPSPSKSFVENAPGLHPAGSSSRSVVSVLEMEDVLFRHDSAIFMPNAMEDSSEGPAGQERISGLAVLKTALIRLQEFPEQSLLITGHTDTSGSSDYNLRLSDQRARAVLHMLQGERDPWAALAHSKHQTQDVQQLLKWTAELRGWDCDPGEIDGKFGPKSQQAQKNFKRAYNEHFSAKLIVNGQVNLETWGAFFDVQQAALAALLDADEATLARDRASLRWLDPQHRSVGCGENWPIDHAEADNYRSETNRRVELLFFDAGEKVTLGCHDTTGQCLKERCPLYPPAPGSRQYLPVHLHPRPQSTPRFFTIEQPGAEDQVLMHSLFAYMARFEASTGALKSLQLFKFQDGRLADISTGNPVPIDCNQEAWFYFSHRDDLLRRDPLLNLDPDGFFKQDRSGLPLLGPIHMPCGQDARIELNIWDQNDWVIVRGVQIDGAGPDIVRTADWKEDYTIGYSARTLNGQPAFAPHGDCFQKEIQEEWKGRRPPIDLIRFGSPGGIPLWVGTLSALPSSKAKLLLVHSGQLNTVNAGSFNEVQPTGANQVFQSHHTYNQALVQRLLALPRSKQKPSDIDALPDPPARALLPGDMCWQDQGQTNHCGAYSFSSVMNYWFPYTNNPQRKDGAVYARRDHVNDVINGARSPRNIEDAATRFKMNGQDNDAEHLDKARALKLIKLWIQAGVPVLFLVKEDSSAFSWHWKTLAGYDGDRFFMNNSGADRELIISERRPGVEYEKAPVGNDVDPTIDFYGKWRDGGGGLVDFISTVDRCTFIPIFPLDPIFAGPVAR